MRDAELGSEALGQLVDQAVQARGGNGRNPGCAGARAARDVREAGDDLIVERPGAQPALDRRPPSAVPDARKRPTGLDAGILRDLAHRAGGVGRHLLGLQLHRP